MKIIARTILAALALCETAAFAEETRKAESAPGPHRLEIGPISVSVSATGREGGEATRTAYLGVVTAPIPPQFRAQLDLSEGMGLCVEAVVKDSPAATAGIKQYDVLKKFDDQMLCAQEQLSVLVKAAGKDAKVSLTILRGGKEQQVSVTLGEHDAPLGGKAQFSINGVPGMSIDVPDYGSGFGRGSGSGFGSGSAGIQQNWEEMRKKNQQRQKEVETQIDSAMKKAQEAARKGREGAEKAGTVSEGKAQVFSFYPDAQSQSVVTIADTEGSVEVNDSNGKRTVKVKDASGKEIHSGPLDTEADHDAVPENFRAKVKDAESKIKSRDAGGLKRKPEKKVEQDRKPDGAI